METQTAEKTARKRPPASAVESATTPEKDVLPAAVPEEEVEEFFAILRRIHVAVKYFEKGGKRCRPSFGKEDFAEMDGGGENDVVKVADGEEEEDKQVGGGEGTGLDLNSDPPPELASADHQNNYE